MRVTRVGQSKSAQVLCTFVFDLEVQPVEALSVYPRCFRFGDGVADAKNAASEAIVGAERITADRAS